jgi:hypothetical protein
MATGDEESRSKQNQLGWGNRLDEDEKVKI